MKPSYVVRVTHVPLDRGGYDRRGRYYGHGRKLYGVEWTNDAEEDHDFLTRASDAKDAARQAGEMYGFVPRHTARRRPAPLADRERAKSAGEYADWVYHASRSFEAMDDRKERCGGYETACYKRLLVLQTRDALYAAEVAADAFEEVHQDRLAKKYRDRAEKLREIYLPSYVRDAFYAAARERLQRGHAS